MRRVDLVGFRPEHAKGHEAPPGSVWGGLLSVWRDRLRASFRRLRRRQASASLGPWLPGEVTLIHAPGDPHHVEIFLQPVLNRLFDLRRGNWRQITYEEASGDLVRDELVILCRPRFPCVREILAGRRAIGRPTVVMIDDNWMAAGREYPRYARLFRRGCPDFEHFLASLAGADATVTFNPLLAADLQPLARSVRLLPIPFDTKPFIARPTDGPGLGPSIGYAGSPRFEPSAFAAMARLAAERPELTLLVMGHEIPPELAAFPPDRLQFEPFRASVADYAVRLSTLRPTVLVAPLDATRFSASKCPLKFLDAAAAGLPGVYSSVPPYADLVRNGVDGLLVENSAASWRRGIARLLDDAALRERIVRAARHSVSRHFSVDRATRAFAKVLSELRQQAGPHR